MLSECLTDTKITLAVIWFSSYIPLLIGKSFIGEIKVEKVILLWGHWELWSCTSFLEVKYTVLGRLLRNLCLSWTQLSFIVSEEESSWRRLYMRKKRSLCSLGLIQWELWKLAPNFCIWNLVAITALFSLQYFYRSAYLEQTCPARGNYLSPWCMVWRAT